VPGTVQAVEASSLGHMVVHSVQGPDIDGVVRLVLETVPGGHHMSDMSYVGYVICRICHMSYVICHHMSDSY